MYKEQLLKLNVGNPVVWYMPSLALWRRQSFWIAFHTWNKCWFRCTLLPVLRYVLPCLPPIHLPIPFTHPAFLVGAVAAIASSCRMILFSFFLFTSTTLLHRLEFFSQDKNQTAAPCFPETHFSETFIYFLFFQNGFRLPMILK